MCAAALATYVWNRPERMEVTSSVMDVEYRKDGVYKLNRYELSNYISSTDNREFRVLVMRGGGGISCNVTVRRSSLDEGSEVTMTHSQIHVAGLREVFTLWKMRIANGQNYNSFKYGAFEADVMHPKRLKMKFYCQLKHANGYYITVPYDLEIKNVYTK